MGKIFLAIIYLASSIISLVRWMRFSLSWTRMSEHSIFMIRTSEGTAARVFGTWEAKAYSVNMGHMAGSVRGWKLSKTFMKVSLPPQDQVRPMEVHRGTRSQGTSEDKNLHSVSNKRAWQMLNENPKKKIKIERMFLSPQDSSAIVKP